MLQTSSRRATRSPSLTAMGLKISSAIRCSSEQKSTNLFYVDPDPQKLRFVYLLRGNVSRSSLNGKLENAFS